VNLPEFASYWAKKLGATEEKLFKLSGGINNHVFLCVTNSQNYVIKCFQPKLTGQSDRMQAEVEFLRYAYQVAPDRVPQLIDVDTVRRCVVLEHIDGSPYAEGSAGTKEDILAAMDFLRLLNADRDLARQMVKMEASEAFLSLREHVVNLRKRIATMGTGHLSTEFQQQASRLLHTLKHRTDLTEERLEAEIRAGLVEDYLDSEFLCVSPSDFGYHNAIQTPSGVKFIDFEFAGWDDPAKTCIDFLLQPRNPANCRATEFLEVFTKDRVQYLHNRCINLFPILELKWLCIILAVLYPERLSNIIETISEPRRDELIKTRLTKAEELMARSSNKKAFILN
jgi:hypothetical protein